MWRDKSVAKARAESARGEARSVEGAVRTARKLLQQSEQEALYMLRQLPALPGGVSGPGFPWLGRWPPQATRREQRLCSGLGGPFRSA